MDVVCICLSCLVDHAVPGVFYHPVGEGYCEICWTFVGNRLELDRANITQPPTPTADEYIAEWPALTKSEAEWLVANKIPLLSVPVAMMNKAATEHSSHCG